jgi:hypothetical protein
VKSQATLVGTYGIVVLYAIAAIDAYIAIVICPAHPEGNQSIRLGHTLQNLGLKILRIVLHVGNDIGCDFSDSLMKFRLTRVSFDNTFHEGLQIGGSLRAHFLPPRSLRRVNPGVV